MTMTMTLQEAKQECAQWLDYQKGQEDKAAALQQLAVDRRDGRCTGAEGKRRFAAIQGSGVTAYDGAKLAEALRVFLKHV